MKRIIWLLGWTVLIFCLFFALTGCSSHLSPAQQREKALSSRTDEVVIGVVWPFSRYDDQFQDGLELALEQINRQGVLGGKKIRLILRDDADSVTRGMGIAHELAENTSISAVIGHRSSNVTVPVSRIYDNAGILLISPASTSPKLTSINSHFIFRNIPSDEQIGQQLAIHAAGQGYQKAVIYYTDNEYGRGLANAFEDQAKELGLTIVDRIAGYKDAADVRRIADKWNLLDAEVLMLATEADEGLAFLRLLRAAGFDKPAVGGDGLDTDPFAQGGAAAEGVLVATIYQPHSPSRTNQQFREQFIAKYGTEPGKWAAQAYDSLLLLSHAIEQAGSPIPRHIAAQLQNLESWEGAAGSRSFESNGNVQGMDAVMKVVKNGAFQYLEH